MTQYQVGDIVVAHDFTGGYNYPDKEGRIGQGTVTHVSDFEPCYLVNIAKGKQGWYNTKELNPVVKDRGPGYEINFHHSAEVTIFSGLTISDLIMGLNEIRTEVGADAKVWTDNGPVSFHVNREQNEG